MTYAPRERPAEPTMGWPRRPPLAGAAARALLRDGEAELLGRMPWSSNATYLVCLSSRSTGGELLAVYKPERGERPLWDFPRGSLGRREVAACEVSEALGWGLVPDTVVRGGPAGPGMMQRFVDHDPEEHYFTLLDDHRVDFLRMALFDVVINNADRKGGHCLRDRDGRIWGVDHGVSLHEHWKLRTVIWEFADDPIPAPLAADLRRLLETLADPPDRGAGGRAGRGLAGRLGRLLSPDEIAAVRDRTETLLERGALPEADPGHHSYPWPLV